MLNRNNKLTISRGLRGVTMLENLVALLILSIGLLGLAGLQASTLRNGHDANLRTIAVQQARDMANRIRSNPQGVVDGKYDAIEPPATTPANECTSSCNADEMALFDAWQWNTANAASLPGGGGTVVGADILGMGKPTDMARTKRFTITVRWDADRSGGSGLGCNPSSSTDLKCVVLQVVAP